MAKERDYFIQNIIPLKNKLFRKALYITESVEDSQDIVQDVMITLWNKRAGWNEIKNMEVYAMVLTKNQALDRIKNKAGKNDSIDDKIENQVSCKNNNPLESVIKNEETSLVWHIINQLSDNQKKLVILREIDEHTYLEIAEIMQTTEAQVKINLYRARQKIKELYLKIDKYGL
jgi:RNA polymerase sigma-70 factor, ECF subfamily